MPPPLQDYIAPCPACLAYRTRSRWPPPAVADEPLPPFGHQSMWLCIIFTRHRRGRAGVGVLRKGKADAKLLREPLPPCGHPPPRGEGKRMQSFFNGAATILGNGRSGARVPHDERPSGKRVSATFATELQHRRNDFLAYPHSNSPQAFNHFTEIGDDPSLRRRRHHTQRTGDPQIQPQRDASGRQIVQKNQIRAHRLCKRDRGCLPGAELFSKYGLRGIRNGIHPWGVEKSGRTAMIASSKNELIHNRLWPNDPAEKLAQNIESVDAIQ